MSFFGIFDGGKERNWVEEKYSRLDNLIEQIDEEIGVELIEDFSWTFVHEETEIDSKGQFFRQNGGKKEDPFKKEMSPEELEKYEDAGFLDTHDFGGTYELYTLTELGENLGADSEVLDSIVKAEKVLERDMEEAASLAGVEGEIDRSDDRPVTSGDPDEDLAVKKMQQNGASELVMTEEGVRYKDTIDSVEMDALEGLLELERSYEPSPLDKMEVIEKDLPYLDQDEAYELSEEALTEMKDMLAQMFSRVSTEEAEISRSDEELLGRGIETLKKYTEVARERFDLAEDKVESWQYKAEGLMSFYHAAGGSYNLGEDEERNDESLAATLEKTADTYRSVVEKL